MACGGRQRWEGTEELGAFILDYDLGGDRSEGVGNFFKAVLQEMLLFGEET